MPSLDHLDDAQRAPALARRGAVELEREHGPLAGRRRRAQHPDHHRDAPPLVWPKVQRATVLRDPYVSRPTPALSVVHARPDRPKTERSGGAVVHDDSEPLSGPGVQAADMSAEGEALLRRLALRAERAERAGPGQRSRCDHDDRECRRAPSEAPHTTTVRLLTLSGPRQFAVAGVIVYCQEPAGTPLSMQVSALIVPVQLAPIVWRTPVVAL